MSGSASRKDTLRSKTLQGGYMISMEVALEWANHLRKEIGKPELSGNIRSQGPIMLTLDEKVKEVGGVECNLHGGLRKGEGFRHCFIVTQYGEGLLKRSIKRDCDIDPSQYLERGEIEEVMEEVLREAGIEHSGFTTILYR
ncbi:hypothetical protein AX16_004285 [Volvariella volvacea WC 439]|nr:hypothetical protein AX16_004285 [Volvariella volvacea WC 439]